MNQNKTFLPVFFAFFLGIFFGIGFILLEIKVIGWVPGGGEEVLAQIGKQKLTVNNLPAQIASELVPSENDRYRILARGVDAWMETRLLDREARATKTKAKDLYVKEIWSKVKAANGPARQSEYEKIKKEYLGILIKKHEARVFLVKPANYVENLAVPVAPPAPTPAAAAAPGAAPAEEKVTFDDLVGRPSVGPENAPITLVEFSDFDCPFCSRAEPTIAQLMKSYEGKIRRVWRHYPLAFHQGADKRHEASECAAEQGKFWEYHDKLFERQGQLKDDAALVGLAKELRLDTKKFEACVTGRKYQGLIQKEIAKGNQSGVQGTPTIFINGQRVVGAVPYENFKAVVENIFHPGLAPAQPTPAAVAPPPAPAKPVVFDDLQGKPSKGPENAPVTIVEFSDFHCPFCTRVEPTMDQIMKNYAGKVRLVWRHYPLPFHAGAERTHEASQCAADQGKFWEYHAKLFATQGQARDEAALIRLGEEVGLKKGKFEKCVRTREHQGTIQRDIARGSEAGVRGTPAFFVNGELLSGAQPYESFDRLIQEKLKKA